MRAVSRPDAGRGVVAEDLDDVVGGAVASEKTAAFAYPDADPGVVEDAADVVRVAVQPEIHDRPDHLDAVHMRRLVGERPHRFLPGGAADDQHAGVGALLQHITGQHHSIPEVMAHDAVHAAVDLRPQTVVVAVERVIVGTLGAAVVGDVLRLDGVPARTAAELCYGWESRRSGRSGPSGWSRPAAPPGPPRRRACRCECGNRSTRANG